MAERRLGGSASTSERDIVNIGGHEVMPIPHAEGKTYTLFACIRGAEDGIIQSTFRASARGDCDAPAPRLKTQALAQMPVDALARGPGPHHTHHPSLAFQATLQ